jgi:hypothetical protein
MESFEKESNHENERFDAYARANRWGIVAVVVLLAIAGLAMAYGVRQRSLAQQLTEQATITNASMNQLQNQVSMLTAKLNEMTVAQTAATQANSAPGAESSEPAETVAPAAATAGASPSAAPHAKSTAVKRANTKKRPVVDKRYAQLKAQLDAQGKELKDTQDLVAKNRSDLEGNISSTRDELNGSIARTHDELVVLQKRGERSYTEFDLTKSKQFQRIGPLTLSLRKTDTKHNSYDLALILDDNQLNKKKVNLYEPIWIHQESAGQPIQIVVNRIDKNLVHGYVSSPKYKQSELANASFSGTAPVASSNAQQTTPPPQQ